ncbi:MAG: CBS domain-containing protein [Planctomycetes bacterium]|nr:CBS domain-containing protein [Planctomycetota bacterium]
MWERDCGALVVVHANGTVAGMVTDRDACIAAWTQGRALRDIVVGSAMAFDVVKCRADENVATITRRMAERQVRRLPVVDDDNRPIGVVSLCDVAREAATQHGFGDGSARRLAETLATVTRRPIAAAAAEPVQEHATVAASH